jgi:hypothetical protein
MVQLQETLTDGTIDLKVETLRPLPEQMPAEAYILTAYSFPQGVSDVDTRATGLVQVMWMGVAPVARISANKLLEQGMAAFAKTLDTFFVESSEELTQAMLQARQTYQKYQLEIEDEQNSIALLIPVLPSLVDNHFSKGIVHTGLYNVLELERLEHLAMNLYRDTFEQRNLQKINKILPKVVSDAQSKMYGFNLSGIRRRLQERTVTSYFGVSSYIMNELAAVTHSKPGIFSSLSTTQ